MGSGMEGWDIHLGENKGNGTTTREQDEQESRPSCLGTTKSWIRKHCYSFLD